MIKKVTIALSLVSFGYWLARYTHGIVGMHIVLETEEDMRANLAVEMFDAVHDMVTTNANVALIREKLNL